MKKVLKNVSFIFLLLKMCFVFGQQPATQKRIVIDPGHGGKDSGAVGINKIQEKDIVLAIAQEIIELNNRFGKPLDIYLTRYKDTLISLSDRTKLAKALNADLFISLHCNSSTNNSRGMEIYTSSTLADEAELNIQKSFTLGTDILKESTVNLNFETRGIKYANFQVLREAIKGCPAILIEVGFLTNHDEGNYFSKSTNIEAIALAILRGTEKYLKPKL